MKLEGRILAVTVDQLRGVEGAAAAGLFGGYTQVFAPELDFTGRNRRPPHDPVNAALSLAYTLLHADAIQGSAHGWTRSDGRFLS